MPADRRIFYGYPRQICLDSHGARRGVALVVNADSLFILKHARICSVICSENLRYIFSVDTSDLFSRTWTRKTSLLIPYFDVRIYLLYFVFTCVRARCAGTNRELLFKKLAKFHSCYELMPNSAKLVLFDTELTVNGFDTLR